MPPETTIRLAVNTDLPKLREIECSAGAAFRALNMAAVADDDPPSLEDLDAYRQVGLAWVATERRSQFADNPPVAYLVARVVDGCLHIDQVSVHADHARRGIGRRLIEHTARQAVARGLPALTLTTFVNVPWNAPYYERCGFHRLPDEALTPGLRAIRDHEAALGLDIWPRICMRRAL